MLSHLASWPLLTVLKSRCLKVRKKMCDQAFAPCTLKSAERRSLSFQYIMVVIILRTDAAPSWLGIGILLAGSFLRYIQNQQNGTTI